LSSAPINPSVSAEAAVARHAAAATTLDCLTSMQQQLQNDLHPSGIMTASQVAQLITLSLGSV
jgi:hypothetical protein